MRCYFVFEKQSFFYDFLLLLPVRHFTMKTISENQAKEKTKKKSKRKRAKSESDSDWEDEEEDRLPNPLVLAGPTGSGKSALVSYDTSQPSKFKG